MLEFATRIGDHFAAEYLKDARSEVVISSDVVDYPLGRWECPLGSASGRHCMDLCAYGVTTSTEIVTQIISASRLREWCRGKR